ncbi:MAG: hypothetical protein WAP54_06895 [Bacteroidales bacterium]|jgi:hypothetical protein
MFYNRTQLGIRFQSEERRQEYFNANPFKEYQVFQKVIEYIT